MGEDGWRQRDGTAGCTDGWLCSAHGYFSFLLWSRIALETICNTHFMSPSLASALSYCSAVSEKTYGLVSVAASTRHVLLFAANTVSSEQPSILTIIYINNKMKPHINSLGLKNLNWLFIFWHSSVGLLLQRPVLHKSVQRPAVKASAVGRYIPDQLRSSVWNRVLGVLMKAIGWVTIPCWLSHDFIPAGRVGNLGKIPQTTFYSYSVEKNKKKQCLIFNPPPRTYWVIYNNRPSYDWVSLYFWGILHQWLGLLDLLLGMEWKLV